VIAGEKKKEDYDDKGIFYFHYSTVELEVVGNSLFLNYNHSDS